jgi:hypothetical protein
MGGALRAACTLAMERECLGSRFKLLGKHLYDYTHVLGLIIGL